MAGKWKLNPKEVESGGGGVSSSGKNGQFSRRLKITSSSVMLVHIPTGITVEGTIPPGRYSKNEMKKLKEDMRRKLFAVLEAKVGRHLRIPGR